MNSRRFYLLMLVVFITAALSLNGVFAQESTETPEATETTGDTGGTGGMGDMGSSGTVACDSDLILSWYIAERFFGYSSFNNQLSSDMMVDLNAFDRGQFGSMFDDIDSASAADFSDETRSSVNDMLLMDDAAFDEQMGMMGGDGSMSNLSTGMMDEAEECAALRASLRRFYRAIALSDTGMSSSDSGTSDSNTNTDTGSTGSDTGSSDDGSQEGVIEVTLSGAAEVPGPGDADGTGTATVYLRSTTNEVCVDLSVQAIALPATAAHIHQAPAGEAGPPVVTLTSPNDVGLSNTCTTVDAALMQEMVNNPQNFYVNVHNGEFPDGAVRGQMQ